MNPSKVHVAFWISPRDLTMMTWNKGTLDVALKINQKQLVASADSRIWILALSPTHSHTLYASIKSLNVRGALITIYIGHGSLWYIVNNDIVHDGG